MHLHGSGLHLTGTGAPAIATNPAAIAQSDAIVHYEWMVGEDEQEGTHYFHSHGDDRLQTSHGLFGALIVEPKGSVYLDPISGGELLSGWATIIQDPGGSDFREFAIVYHEIGNERYLILNRVGRLVPLVDSFTDAYRPGSRAINYRSEPFMNRLALQQQTHGAFDPAQAYGSYTFGDPATPIARIYLGDPVKQRVIHGGSEVFHVHHVHGGAIRWRRQPGVEPTAFDSGFDKTPPLLPQASARADSQAIGPSETYDLENECGSGGCQESVGDFLIHCHVAHHYISGMWMFWRVYNTNQGDTISQDALPPLPELPDKEGQVETAVTSQDLVGRKVDWKGQSFSITQEGLAAWVERQLPPPGVPKGYDASVLDWRRDGELYLNEPDSDRVWPGFRSPTPGTRPPFYFNPKTGKLAYPFLRPHLGQRPPFAPNHGPAPFLSPMQQGTDPPQPGENGPWSLCPTETKLKEFVIHAINLPITLNQKANLVDPVGQLFVLKEQEEEVRANRELKVPLAIRANAGEDCIDIIFKSELEDTGENDFFSKVNIHIHFVQLDIQASDGVIAGFNYEQSVRPFTVEGAALLGEVSAGASTVGVGSAERFQPGVLVGVGMDQDETFEISRIQAIDGDTLIFEEPLRYPHVSGEIVSSEFVRYRWYPDVQFGTAYFHDHVNALTSWKHGLFGAFIAEPPRSPYHHPRTGAEVKSGPTVHIRTDSVVSEDVTGNFRELVLFIQDDNPLTNAGDSSGSSFNLRVEPLSIRGGDPTDSQGVSAGLNTPQAVFSGDARTYTYYAHPEVGEIAALVRDWGNVLVNPGFGLYGAIIAGPKGATYTHPVTGEDMSLKAGWKVDVHPPSVPSYRNFALFLQEEDEVIGTHLMPYAEQVESVVGLNYAAEPLRKRLETDKDTSRVFSSAVHGAPAMPILEAFAGDSVKVQVVVPFSEQAQVFTSEGHRWPLEPGRAGSDLLSSVQVGGLEAISIEPVYGAGGRAGLPGDYLYGDHREPYRVAGLWGFFRVHASGSTTNPRPLPGPWPRSDALLRFQLAVREYLAHRSGARRVS